MSNALSCTGDLFKQVKGVHKRLTHCVIHPFKGLQGDGWPGFLNPTIKVLVYLLHVSTYASTKIDVALSVMAAFATDLVHMHLGLQGMSKGSFFVMYSTRYGINITRHATL